MSYEITQVQPVVVANNNLATNLESRQGKIYSPTGSWKLGNPIQEATQLVKMGDGRLLLTANPGDENLQESYKSAETLMCQ